MSNGTTVTTTTKLSDVPDYQQVYIPKSTYRHKVVNAEFKLSQASGNPMFQVEVEITDHAGFPDVKNPGKAIDPNGTKATVFLSLTEKAAGNVKTFFKACGLPTDLSIQDLVANPNPAFLLGKTFLAVGYSKAEPQIDEVSKQPIKNPVTGQDLVYYRYQVGQVFAM